MMIDIQKVDLVGMNNGAHYEFMKVVNDRFAAETTLSTNASAKKAMEALAAALKEEDRCLVISRRNLITDDIRAADKTRDDIFRSLRKAINGFTDAPVPDVAQAAKELQQCLVDYRIDPAMQLDRETGLLHNFIADLETKYAAQVTKLGLTLFVAPLKEANAKVEQFIVNRTTFGHRCRLSPPREVRQCVGDGLGHHRLRRLSQIPQRAHRPLQTRGVAEEKERRQKAVGWRQTG